MGMRVLFVCGGNTCRSSMAAGIGSAFFPELEWSSAGLDPGLEVAQKGCLAVRELTGGDISKHIPRDLEDLDLKRFDIVVALDS